MKKQSYCVYCKLNDEYILYIACTFGGFSVFVTNENHTTNYSVYGSYRNIGTAENRLLKSAESYKANTKEYMYMDKEKLIKEGVWKMILNN